MQRWSILWFSEEESSYSDLHIQNIHYIKQMLKNGKRFVETNKDYASNIHTFSLTDNFQKSRKKGKKRKKLLEVFFRRCSIKKVFLNILQN